MQKHEAILQSVIIVLAICLVVPSTSNAQAPPAASTCTGSLSSCDPPYTGDNNVFAPLTGTTTQQLNAHDYVDASMFIPANPISIDICTAIGKALTQVGLTQVGTSGNQYSAKAIIDARGIYPLSAGGKSSPGSVSCAQSPWNGVSSIPYAVTILLPAGTIYISATWVLPQNTQIIGEGPNATTIQACTTPACSANFPAGSDMIDMGTTGTTSLSCPSSSSKPPDCNGMAIAHLTVNASNLGINGIVNYASQEQSYVNDVAIKQVASPGVGLEVFGQSSSTTGDGVNSGPYSDIYFSSGTGTCVSIQGTYGIRGIRGLSCKGSSGATTAVLLDGSNTTIQDVYISGYTNGIVIGSQGIGAQNDLIFDVTGTSNVGNLIEICAPITGNSGPCPATLAITPSDITLIAVSSGGGNTIVDQVTGNTLQYGSAEPDVGLWVVGEPMSASPAINSWFTTSHAFPTWYVGSNAPTGLSCNASEAGSLFSVISTNSGATFSGCVSGTWSTIQQ